jgi:hypothetical protein
MSELEYKKKVLEYKERELKYLKEFQKSNEEDREGAFTLLGVFIALLIGAALYTHFIF